MPASAFGNLIKVLSGRLARNIYFWALELLSAHGLNSGNDAAYGYGITSSSWYVPVMAASLLIQCSLVYTNNLWLVPRFLARRRRLAYTGLMLGAVAITSLLYVALFKAARPHINVEEIQHPAFIVTVISPGWNLAAVFDECLMFFIGELGWILVFTMAWYMNDYARQQRALQRSEHLRVQAELAFLKNQINPHFLFNNLNNIYGLSLQKADTTPEAILKLSSILRYLLYDSAAQQISFQREQAAIEAYVEIEALRLPDDASISLDISADKDYLIPALLWMPQLENTFKHGTRLINMPVSVDFRFHIRNGQLSIAARNHFMDGNNNPATDGIGLANLRKRLELLFPGRYSFTEQRKDNTYSSILNIQLA